MACGRIGLSFDYLYNLTSRQFSNIQEGWNGQQEMLTKTSWEQTRSLYDAIIRPHLKDKKKSAKDIFPFPWDKEIEEQVNEKVPEITTDEMEERWKKIDAMNKENIGKL
ncbi:hypothetical protein NJB85_02130 [Myroides odoratimimus]|uniref:hypothetical protein n=1 Tax=Myroides odoratimimus TaxID=76832 RepID=UPI0020981198|nr:hypothetical protein [Myroides odoratimimus]MCO7721975.1 hypothetical protein [Myroides odoratimimus]